MNLLSKAEVIKDMVQDAVDAGATNIEEVHKSVAKLSMEQLENMGLLDPESAQEKQDLVNKSIGQIYDSIRNINNRVGEFASDIFEGIEDAKDEHKED
ncbi:MAG: hypothetical protein JKY24_00545 [Pseudomonadales bacterium]|nr:hypothetical protein [Pseudomonadales bacterium]